MYNSEDVAKLLVTKYFEENSLIKSDIDSFNHFVNVELGRIIEENKYVIPTIVPANVEDFKIRFDKIWVGKPTVIDADGSERDVFPSEARLRKLSYSAPIFLEVSSHVNGVQRESFVSQIGLLPIMLKSDLCHLKGLSREELIAHGEDPDDEGGYFIVNGSEKTIVKIEDLAPNVLLVSKAYSGTSEYLGKLFSEFGSYKIPHLFEKLKDSLFYLSFTRVRRMPIIPIFKALGLVKDADIMAAIDVQDDPTVFINLYEFVDITNQEDALDYVARKMGITQSKEIRIQRIQEILDRYLMPHLGVKPEDRIFKAINIAKHLKKFILVSNGTKPVDDVDHYMNKRLKMSGSSLADLFRSNFKVLMGDILYNFQRIVKRGKFPSINILIRNKLLTQKIYSAIATGTWIGGRRGVAQRIERLNFLQTLSQLQRVISPLSSSQENFDARALHCTHYGRLCPSETPEGSNIGLRKNLALLSDVTHAGDEALLYDKIKSMGLKPISRG